MNDKYMIATVKSWNISKAQAMKRQGKYRIDLITDPSKLTYDRVKSIDPRYIFFPHWSWKIPEEIYGNWECIVFHMTDLPYGRGGSPLQNLIYRGVKKTKITALRVEEEMDAGKIYLKRSLDISKGSAENIYDRASFIVFREMIPYIIRSEPSPKRQQGKPTIFKRRKQEQSNLEDLTRMQDIYDQIRMVDAEGYPKAFLETAKIKYEFFAAEDLGDRIKAEVLITRRK
jgi:methionyl-tRNA formyltransferase